MLRLRRKDKTRSSYLLGLASRPPRSTRNFPCQQARRKSRRTRWVHTRKLEFDSISPPRPESNYASMFRIRARGLEFDVDQRCFAQEQLTGPDPSGVPGSLINYPYD